MRSVFTPSGDQPQAIEKLVHGLQQEKKNQVLLGITGSGKTFTMANIINILNRPALIMAHNKTLAAQLYSEMKEFFPENAVEYFVSYYDYYQPEAYIPNKDVYIEKDSRINETIDQLRHSATRNLLERKDVIVVASVSCIYGLGSPELYLQATFSLEIGQTIKRDELVHKLVVLQYERNDIEFSRGTFRVRGDNLDIFPSHYQDTAWRISFFGNDIESIYEIDSLTCQKNKKLNRITIFSNSHYIMPRPTVEQSIQLILAEMKERVAFLRMHNKLVEAYRLETRTKFDMEMLMETGSCKGIENYSRYVSGRGEGEPPPTLFEYLPKDAILFVDESHVTVPQVRGMFNGDRARKINLVEYGFRLPSALDNRPLRFEEWDRMRPNTIFVSATPGTEELALANGEYVEQLVRPTGLLDPMCEIRPVSTQVDDLLNECKISKAAGIRVLVTTLTKKMAEDLNTYLNEINVKSTYIHSDVKTIERMEIIRDLRKGIYDVLVGVNLLREGLDIPECGLVAILDADKQGFLRSVTSLIQTIGRAARNVDGKVLLYADRITDAIHKAMTETARRRMVQTQYNIDHNITPQTINKNIIELFENMENIKDKEAGSNLKPKEIERSLSKLKDRMFKAAANLEFELAAQLRDQVHNLEQLLIKVVSDE